jgi:hypothetical protein
MMRQAPLAAGLLLALAGCGRTPPADDLFPLAGGHRWTYRVTTRTDDGAVVQESLTLDTINAEPMADAASGIAGHRRSDEGVDYWLRADASGVYRVATQGMADPAPRTDPPQRYVLKAPYAAGTHWQATTTAYLLARRFDFPREVRHTYPPVTMEYRIEAAGEAVDVPAGRYAGCLRVRGSATMRVYADPVRGWREAPLTTLEWYCRGVGLVRLERSEVAASSFMTGGTRILELVSFR